MSQNLAAEESENAKADSECTFWDAATSSMETSKSCSELMSEIEDLQIVCNSQINFIKKINTEEKTWDSKINALKEEIATMEKAMENERLSFTQSMDDLIASYTDIDELMVSC